MKKTTIEDNTRRRRFLPPAIKGNVMAIRGKSNQILKTIIRSVFIEMVNRLMGKEISPQKAPNDKSMFKNIAPRIRIGMARAMDINVTIISISPGFPIPGMIPRSVKLSHFFSKNFFMGQRKGAIPTSFDRRKPHFFPCFHRMFEAWFSHGDRIPC